MHTYPDGAATELLDRLPAADVRAAVDRLMAVCAGDPVLLCALAFTAAGLDAATRDRLLRDVLRGRPSAPSEMRGPVLTDRQREVLGLLGAGLTARAIAHQLALSPRTVGKHLERVYRRLGTSDRLTAVITARHCGLLPDASVRGAGRRIEGDDSDAER